mgnify:CR=1 FL=1
MQNDQRLLNRPKSYEEKTARASFNSINSVILDSRVPVINSSSNILGSQTIRQNTNRNCNQSEADTKSNKETPR